MIARSSSDRAGFSLIFPSLNRPEHVPARLRVCLAMLLSRIRRKHSLAIVTAASVLFVGCGGSVSGPNHMQTQVTPSSVRNGIERIEGQSLVLVGNVSDDGEWSLKTSMVVDKPASRRDLRKRDYELRLIHIATGTVLYREWLQLLRTADSDVERRTWGLRIPAFDATGLLVSIVDLDGNIVFKREISTSGQN